MRYIVAWAYIPRPVHSEIYVFDPTSRFTAIAQPEQLSEKQAFELTQKWFSNKVNRASTKVVVVTGIDSTSDPANPDLPSGLPCTNCQSTHTRLISIRAPSKQGEPETHTWQCLHSLNAHRNKSFPCEACIVCQHSLDLWDHLYHICDAMRAAGVPPIFLRPNYESTKAKNGRCQYCGWGPTNVTCTCRFVNSLTVFSNSMYNLVVLVALLCAHSCHSLPT